MRRLSGVLLIAALVALILPFDGAGAQSGPPFTIPTTRAWVVHGLNLDGQSSPDDRGTSVTVCSGAATVVGDLQFGDVIGPVDLRSGGDESLQVYLGADVDCADPGAAALLIDQAVPEATTAALVATSNGVELAPELLVVPLDLSCVEVGTGRAVAVHAANAPEVDVVNTNLGGSVGTLSYGEQLAGPLPPGTYGIDVFTVDEPPALVTSFDVDVIEGAAGIGYAVGGQPDDPSTPIVLVPQQIDVGLCSGPTETTLPPGTTLAPEPPSAVTAAGVTAPARPAMATPSYTG
jgi:hypothetical protein